MTFVPLRSVMIGAIVASLWSSGNAGAVDVWIAIRRPLALGLFIGTMPFCSLASSDAGAIGRLIT
jgi:hypothetical protein